VTNCVSVTIFGQKSQWNLWKILRSSFPEIGHKLWPTVCRSQFSVKKANEICEEYYGTIFKNRSQIVTNCVSITIFNPKNQWNPRKNITVTILKSSPKFGHKLWPTACRSQFFVKKKIICFVVTYMCWIQIINVQWKIDIEWIDPFLFFQRKRKLFIQRAFGTSLTQLL